MLPKVIFVTSLFLMFCLKFLLHKADQALMLFLDCQDLLDRSGDEEQVAKLKKDLKRTKALLKDAQMMIEKSQNEGTNKVIMRQLKNQVGGILE